MTKLSANLNKIALVRNSRDGHRPDPVALARLALDAGAFGITLHPRPDYRHARPDDVQRIAALLREPAYANREFNIEGNPFEGDWMQLVEQARPAQATLVPDSLTQTTSDHGWSFPNDTARLTPIVQQLKQWGCRVSLFVDPEPNAMQHVPATGADRIELYTESFAQAHAAGDWQTVREAYAATAEAAHQLGLGVNAGHDLDLSNLSDFLAGVPHVAEVSIGHALTADALELGMPEAVRRYVAICG